MCLVKLENVVDPYYAMLYTY